MLNEKGSLNRLLSQKEAYIPPSFADDIEAALSELSEHSIKDSFEKIQDQYSTILNYCK